MSTDITRQVSASVYENITFREKIYSFIKDKYHAVVDSYGINTVELLKHVCNARRQQNRYYKNLFLPSLVFWVSVLLTGAFSGELGSEGLLFLVAASFLVIAIIVFTREIDKRNFLKKHLSKNAYTEDFSCKKDSAIIEGFQRRLGGNVVFYSGYTPFVGSGLDIGGWSFVVDIDKGKNKWDEMLDPLPFREEELYDAISKELSGLDIPNLTVKDRVFVNGKTIRDNGELLPDILAHPVNSVSGDYVKLVMNNDIKDARFYKVIQIIDWQGDLVLTNYLRLKKDQKCLFVESNYFLLPPISMTFKQIDALKEEPGFGHQVLWFFQTLIKSVAHALLSIFVVFGFVGKAISEFFSDPEAAIRKQVKCSPDYDYGASTSIREALAQGQYAQHFQKLDKERYFKIIEKRIFNLISDFLDERNIDTSEFKERESSILNQGVIVTGGKLSSQNLAVGSQAKVRFSNKRSAATDVK